MTPLGGRQVASVMVDSLGRKPALTMITIGSTIGFAAFWVLPTCLNVAVSKTLSWKCRHNGGRGVL